MPDLPVRIDARVVEYLRFYRDSERGRALARQWAERSGRFVQAVQAELERSGLPVDLVWLSMVESGHDPGIRSRAGALGLWQFMPSTARNYGLAVDRWVDERYDPELSTLAAVRFLRELQQRYGSWELAMAAYNMGPGGLSRAIQKFNTNDYWLLSRYEAAIPRETALYVPKIVATALVMNNKAAFGLADVVPADRESQDTVVVDAGRALSEVAQAAGVPLAEVLRLNPQFVARRAPPAGHGLRRWRLHLPPGKGAELTARLSALPLTSVATSAVAAAAADVEGVSVTKTVEVPPAVDTSARGVRVAVVPPRRFQYTTRTPVFYEVLPNDRLEAILSAFRVTEPELLLWNSLDPRARLQPGQVLQLFVDQERSLAGVRHVNRAEVQVLEAGSVEFYDHFEARAGRVRLVLAARAGDTLRRIGDRYGIRANSMERINQRPRNEVLAAGDEVVVYVKPWRAAQVSDRRLAAQSSKPNPAVPLPGAALPAPELAPTISAERVR
jgi:membrane-bound lytic murein transglycosylase D